MVASAMDSPSWGIMMGIFGMMGKLEAEEIAHSGADGFSCGAVSAPEIGVKWDWGIFGVEALGGSVEETETFGGHAGDDFGGDSAPRPGFADGEESAGAGHAGEDGIGVERFDRPKIDDLDFPAFGGEFLGAGEGFVEHGAVGHDGGVSAWAGDAGFSDG